MLNKDYSVQTHDSNNNNNNSSSNSSSNNGQDSSSLLQDRSSSNNDTFNYAPPPPPSSPKPTVIISQQPHSYHAAITTTSIIKNKRRTRRHDTIKKSSSLMAFHHHNKGITITPPPPQSQNRLAFINAVKMAWTFLHCSNKQRGGKSNSRSNQHHYNNKKMMVLNTTTTTTTTTSVETNNNTTNMMSHSVTIINNTSSTSTSNINNNNNKLDFPPITAEALSELSVSELFKSLQIRHDLLLEPNLTFRPNLTSEKRQESELYWSRLDHLIKTQQQQQQQQDDAMVVVVRNLLTELSLILISLISPFPKHLVVWHWPPHITKAYILSVLDPDLIHQELVQGCLDVEVKFEFLNCVLKPLCPPEQCQKMQQLVHIKEYARALELCFLMLETIKLDCANKALHYYRPWLIETGPSLEWNILLKQLDLGQVNTCSVSQWMKYTYDRLGHDAKFINVFRAGLLNLVTDDHDTATALKIPITTHWPITFIYDEKRLKHQLRHEFQNIIVIALLLMPYRFMAGKRARQIDLIHLKTTFSKLLKDASISSGRVSCFHLALHACHMVKVPNQIEQARYWSNWMNQNLRNTSPVYRIMYDRVRTILLSQMAEEEQQIEQHATLGLEKEIGKLGRKFGLIADYNLRTFGSLYTYLLPSVRNSLSSSSSSSSSSFG